MVLILMVEESAALLCRMQSEQNYGAVEPTEQKTDFLLPRLFACAFFLLLHKKVEIEVHFRRRGVGRLYSIVH